MVPTHQAFTFGELLKGYRLRNGVSQTELAARIGKHRNTITNWENGEYRPEDRADILLLEHELHLSPAEVDTLLYGAQFPLEYYARRTEPTTSARTEDKSYGYLRLKQSGQVDKYYELKGTTLRIGRHPHECQLVIPDRFLYVSRIHAIIYCEAGQVSIEDANSKHGTFIDGVRLATRTRLAAGQYVLLGGRSPRAEVGVLEFSLQPASTA